MPQPPSPNGSNGRGPNGRFAKGNSGGPGNPHGQRTAALRSILLDRVKDKDFAAVIDSLIASAKGGDLIAIRELLDRLIGKTVPMDLLERVEALEHALLSRSNRHESFGAH